MTTIDPQHSRPLNLTVVRGPCPAPPVVRRLESGTRLATFAIRTDAPGGATSVPIVWWEPGAWLEASSPGVVLLVVGRTRRRFHQGSSGPVGRVEVEAETVVPDGDRRRARAALRRAVAALAAEG